MSLARDLGWQKYDMESRTSLAYQFARYALRLNYESLPKEVVHAAKRSLLDTLGVAIGAYIKSPGRPVCEAAAKELGGPEEATLFGSGLRTSALNASLVNSFLVRFLDYNDNGGGCHNSDCMASIIAVCEREKANGKDLLNSIVISYELGARVGLIGPGAGAKPSDTNAVESTPSERPRSPVHFLDSRAGLTMPPALGKIMGLNEDQIANAIGICASHSFALGVIMREEPTMSKNIRFGWIAHDAILSCILAKNGFTGPVRVFEGGSGLTALSRVANTGLEMALEREIDFSGWRMLYVRYKYFRGEGAFHGQMQAAIDIVKENDLKPEDIKLVRLKSGLVAFSNFLFKYPRVAEAADHSPYFTTAIAIKERKLDLDSYDPEKFADPVVLDLIDKIVIEQLPGIVGFSVAGAIEIVTNDDRHFEKRVDTPHGQGDEPLTDRELEDKFRQIASKYMDENHIQTIFDTVWKVERLDDISKLTALMVW